EVEVLARVVAIQLGPAQLWKREAVFAIATLHHHERSIAGDQAIAPAQVTVTQGLTTDRAVRFRPPVPELAGDGLLGLGHLPSLYRCSSIGLPAPVRRLKGERCRRRHRDPRRPGHPDLPRGWRQ